MENFPSFYKPDDVGKLYTPRKEIVIREALAAREHIKPVSQNQFGRWSAMVAIDAEIGFTLQGHPLQVQGAICDVQRAIEVIYLRPDLIDEVFFTLDQHFSVSIFFPWWWINDKGQHPEPFTAITSADIISGKWRPIIMQEWSTYLVRKLGKIDVWDEHCEIGTEQARLVPALEEAIIWHMVARDTKPIMMLKGDVLESEFFGVFAPDIQIPGHPRGGQMREALNLLGRYRRTFWWGEAGNICLQASVRQFMQHYEGRRSVLEGLYFITDCTSLINPKMDEYEAFLEEIRSVGGHVLTSQEVLKLTA